MHDRTKLLTAALVLLAACGGGGSSGRDSTAPTVTLTSPVNLSAGLGGAVLLSATAGDNVGVASVEFQIDGVTVFTDPTAPYDGAFATSAFPAGQHIVRARARDAEGNVSAWSQATISIGGSKAAPDGFTPNGGFVTGLNNATAFAQASDGRLFIAEQSGAVRIFKNGVLLAQPFVQLSGVDSINERGLIGIALDPNFTGANPFVYVHYTTTLGGTHNRVTRWNAQGDVAVANSEFPILELPALGATNHNGGAIHFGIDGKLYVGVGDNGIGAQAQDLASPFGKLLRINPDGSIPLDNPFFSTPGADRRIWASGLRNPFTFAVQPGTGRIHINDVGELTWEEINLGAATANYGWPSSEGPDNVGGSITGPLFAYNHDPAVPPGSGPGGFFTGLSIAGGAFYPAAGTLASGFPAAFRGNYYFADFVRGFIGRIDLANDNAAYAFGSVSGNPVDLLVATDGALLVLTRSGVTRFSVP